MNRFAVWALIGGVALAASLCAHALQLALEDAGWFGQVRSAYAHGAQTPMALVALTLAAFGAAVLVRRAIIGSRSHRPDPDWLLPALAKIRDLGAWRSVGIVLGIQLSAFAAGELIEQGAQSYGHLGFAAFMGQSHASAALVQLVIGVVAAAVLWLFAREACRQTSSIARVARAVLAWLDRPAPRAMAPLLRALSLRAETPAPPLLSLRIANRPPPISASSIV